jgi:hypothetical protein
LNTSTNTYWYLRQRYRKSTRRVQDLYRGCGGGAVPASA